MQTTEPSDAELLADWLVRQREPAFHALVARFAGLVHMAAEASQLTFILLARKAKSLSSRTSLAGWLHLTAVMQAKNLLRKSQREDRKRQLLQAAMETEPSHASNDVWQEMQPVLDDALAALSDKDREALLLRFYRSLTIREIADTLGIATDAAQKRIDRATERLRGKLARRGCQVGGSLSAAMVIGFTADAQAAALPVSILASKAIAAGAVSVITSTSIITTLTATMKSTPFVVPVLVLISSVAVLATQRQSISALKSECALLRAHVMSAGAVASSAARNPAGNPPADKRPIDWKQLVAEGGGLATGIEPGDLREMRATVSLQRRLRPLTRDDLVAALDEIAKLDVSAESRMKLEELIVGLLIDKDPVWVLDRFVGHFPEEDHEEVNWKLGQTFEKWAREDTARATAWLDHQIEVGKFEKRESLAQWTDFEVPLLRNLLSSDPEAAAHRLGSLPADERKDMLRRVASEPINAADQITFAKLAREQVPEADRNQAIAWISNQIKPAGGYPEAAAYLDRINATLTERAATAEQIAKNMTSPADGEIAVGREDVEAMREWLKSQTPETADVIAGKVVAGALGENPKFQFADAAALVLQIQQSSGNDDVLVGFLKSFEAGQHKEQSLKLAEKISDGQLREDVLKKLK